MSDGDQHIMPIGDEVDHIALDTCVCGPRVEPTPAEDGTVRWFYVHHRLDGYHFKDQLPGAST